MRALETITQIFDRCAAARVKASLVLCIAALIFCPLSAHAETASLQYDNNGNITQRTTPLGTTTYTYDPLGRLTSEAGPAKTQTFTYDENGNRLSDGAGSYTYEPVSNRMSTRLGLAVTFDAAGRLTADGTGRTFAYNQAGQLYQVRQGGTLIATYYYDGNGLRTRKVTTASAPQGAQTVIYGYDEQGHLIAELSGTDAPIRSYFWQNDIPLAQMEHQAGDKILYFVTDHLNTPRAAMDETGKVVWRWESDAFGSTLPNEDADGDGDGNLTTINQRFGGYYADVESGLFYAKNRYYSPMIGRFITSDPIGLRGGINTYTYVKGNPLKYVDPTGLAGVLPGPVPLPLPGPSSPGQSKPTDDGSYGGLFPPGTIPTPIDPYTETTPIVTTSPNFPTKDPLRCEDELKRDMEQCKRSCPEPATFSRAWCVTKAYMKYRACKRIKNPLGGYDDD